MNVYVLQCGKMDFHSAKTFSFSMLIHNLKCIFRMKVQRNFITSNPFYFNLVSHDERNHRHKYRYILHASCMSFELAKITAKHYAGTSLPVIVPRMQRIGKNCEASEGSDVVGDSPLLERLAPSVQAWEGRFSSIFIWFLCNAKKYRKRNRLYLFIYLLVKVRARTQKQLDSFWKESRLTGTCETLRALVVHLK